MLTANIDREKTARLKIADVQDTAADDPEAISSSACKKPDHFCDKKYALQSNIFINIKH